jgi:hypothetical protein
MNPTKLMKFFWRLHDATGFPPFGWIGNWFEDHFDHAYSPEFLRGIQEAREDITAGRYEVVSIDDLKGETP